MICLMESSFISAMLADGVGQAGSVTVLQRDRHRRLVSAVIHPSNASVKEEEEAADVADS